MKAYLLTAALLVALTSCTKNGGADPAPTPPLPVVASFTLPASAEATTTVSFQNTSQNAATYKWSFGDGSTATTASVTHTYAQAGTYLVNLRVYGTHQDSAVTSQPLTVRDYDVIAHTSATIPGTYDFTMVRTENTPVTHSLTRAKGVLSVTQTGAATVAVTTPEDTYPLGYFPSSVPPVPGRSAYRFFSSATPSAVVEQINIADFFPPGDSLLFSRTTHIGLSGTIIYSYRCYRRP
jgi:PKD repeat protein